MRKSEKLRVVAIILLSTVMCALLLSSCGATTYCSTKAGNYNTVNR